MKNLAILLALVAGAAHAAPGALDPSFGDQGIYRFFNPAPFPPTSCNGQFFLARYGFTVPAPGGKIIAGGMASVVELNSCSSELGMIARLNANGTPDTTFGPGGVRYFGTTGTDSVVYQRAAVLSDGRVLLVGAKTDATAPAGQQQRLVVTRLNVDGTHDSTFGIAGSAIYPGLGTAKGMDLWLQPDGTALIAAQTQTQTEAGQPTSVVLLRYLANGVLDSTYGTNGTQVLFVESDFPSPLRFARGDDGRVVVAYALSPSAKFRARRFLASGVADPAFAGGSSVDLTYGGYDSGIPVSIALQPDGNIVVSGCDVSGNQERSNVLRLLPDGTSDPAFGTNGVVNNVLRIESSCAQALALQKDGRILVAGRSFAHSSTSNPVDITIARLRTDGSFDPTVNGAGIARLDVGFQDNVGGMFLQPDGKAVVAGYTFTDNAAIVVRFLFDDVGDTDHDGMPDYVELGEGRDPQAKDNDVFANARWFAMQQYRDFVGREGEESGIQFYVNALGSGAERRETVIDAFYGSPEFQGLGAPIARLYYATFLRIPDYAGLVFQMEALRTGTPLGVIANNFTASPEFQATYGSLTDAQYVSLLYQNVLERTASQAEIDYHVGRLSTGVTRGEVMVGFSESPEYTGKVDHAVYITMMYVGMLRRAPEQAGLDYWLAYMDAGNPGLALILGFLNAPEYHNRFLP